MGLNLTPEGLGLVHMSIPKHSLLLGEPRDCSIENMKHQGLFKNTFYFSQVAFV
jgi:hypothetical protein